MYKRALKVVGDTLDGRGRYLLDGDTAISVHPDDSMLFAEHRGPITDPRSHITRLRADDSEYTYRGKHYKYDRANGALSVSDPNGKTRSVDLNDAVECLKIPLDDSGDVGMLSYNSAIHPGYKLSLDDFGDIEFRMNGLRQWLLPKSKSGVRGSVEELEPGVFTALPGSESGYGWFARRKLKKLLKQLPDWKIGEDGTLTNPNTGSKYGLKNGRLAKLAAYIKAAADPRYLRVSGEGEHDIQTAAGDLLTLSADGQEGFISNNEGIFRIHPKGMSYFKGKSVYDYDPIDDKWVNAVSGALLKKMIKRPDLRWEDGVFYNPITGVRYGVQGTRPYYQRQGEDPVRMRLRRKKRKKR